MIANCFIPVVLVLLVDFVSFWGVSEAKEQCSVTITNGTVIGKVISSRDPSRSICSYTAIPFATPPIGPLRFQPPEPAKAWGSLNATGIPSVCPQKDGHAKTMSEDCLYLNVFQPIIKQVPEGGLPVMIWFHGGGFTSGSAALYPPTKILSRGDVVLVVSQYRLGVLGFLSTQDINASGNAGLKDQALSIRWVKENIQAFSGNPDKITIFGESAGGSSVMFQLISPLNNGLIKGVISQSGTALATWALDRDPLTTAKSMSKRVGCSTLTTGTMISCLKEVDWKKLIEEQGKYYNEELKKMRTFIPFAPVVEPNLPGAFITAEPEKIMRTGNIPNIPVMIGANKHDGSFLLGLLYITFIGPLKLDKNPQYLREKMIPDLLKFFQVGADESNGATAASVEMTYLSGANRSNWAEIMPGLVDMLSVYFFKSSIERSAEILSGRNNSVFVYSFEHHSNNTLFPHMTKGPVEHGIAHADELIYLFDIPKKLSADDIAFSNTFVDMWLNFAKYGNPTPSASETYDIWKTYDIVDESYMKLNITPTLIKGYRNSWRPNGFEWN